MAGEQDTGERVLAQTAALFSAPGDSGAVTLLRAVRRLDFEQTDDGYVTESNWHDYYWAAVFYVDAVDIPAFTEEVLRHFLPTLAEVARQNDRPAINSILVRPVLPEPDPSWRQSMLTGSAGPAEAHRRITRVTRRDIIDALRRQGIDWAGRLTEIEFLERLYDLDALPSSDSRHRTARGDIIQHRTNNDDWDDDWVFDDPRFALVSGSDEQLLRFLAAVIHPEVRSDPAEVGQLLEIFNEALGRDGYALTPVDSISGYPVYAGRRVPVSAALLSSQPQPTAPSGGIAEPVASTSGGGSRSQVGAGYETVRRRARGERRDYRLEPKRLAAGGQAEVYRAVHKTSQTIVAFRRLTSRTEDPKARMKRELEVARALEGHPHVMPILDANVADGWLVMPLAEATAAQRREELRDDTALLDLVKSMIDVLAVTHRHDWLHRDIKPQNILLLNGKWTLADWGIVRRPRGETTKVGRTRFSVGTDGFAAPELSTSPHEATNAADIYGLGRVIAWALTGENPQPNVPLYPESPPWRTIVRKTTEHDPAHRPQSAQELLELINTEFTTPPRSLEERARQLQVRAQSGDQAAFDALLGLAVENPGDYDIYLHALTDLHPSEAAFSLIKNPSQARTVMTAMARHVDGDGTRIVQFAEAARAVMWLHEVAAYAAGRRAWDLLDEAVRSMLVWDGAWDQWRAQTQVFTWLRNLSGDAAQLVAAALRDHPSAARHFTGLAENTSVDRRIREAVRTASSAERF